MDVRDIRLTYAAQTKKNNEEDWLEIRVWSGLLTLSSVAQLEQFASLLIR